jgi:site-specific DNA-cytosine methylase
LHYVEQADGYIRAKVPVILFEQVPEARQILNKDWKAKKAGKSPQDQLVEKLRGNGYTVPNGPDGQAGIILNAADLGGVLDRKRLFTVAVIDEMWEHSKGDEMFKWPEERETQRST